MNPDFPPLDHIDMWIDRIGNMVFIDDEKLEADYDLRYKVTHFWKDVGFGIL